MNKKQKKNYSVIFLCIVFFIGVCIAAYPAVSDWWNSFHQSQAVSAYIQQTKSISEQQKEYALACARHYNERLAQKEPHFKLNQDEIAEYESILNVAGTGMIGTIQIPAIDVTLPIYHGTTDQVLRNGAGHLEGSSFPIGGESTHAVLSSHCGLSSAKLFTNLDKLKQGDIFTIDVLGQIVTYQVDQIQVVLPDQMQALSIEQGKDYCTLCTCTPYGVNTHRLLVRGVRVENIGMPKGGSTHTDENNYIICYIVLLLTNVIAIICIALALHRKKNR